MSRANKAPNDLESAKAYIAWLISLDGVDEVWLQGSRSPKRSKEVHEHSDWDLGVVSSVDKFSIIHPRLSGQLHGDLCIVKDAKFLHPKAVLICHKDKGVEQYDNLRKPVVQTTKA